MISRIYFVLALSAGLSFMTSCGHEHQVEEHPKAQDTVYAEPANMRFGFNLDSMEVMQGVIQQNDYLSTILTKNNVSFSTVDKLVENSRDTFDVRKIRPGKSYWIINDPNSWEHVPDYFVYEENATNYIVFCLGDSCYAYSGTHPVETEIQTASGVINSSLYQTLSDQGMSPTLALEMGDIFAWTVDFYRLQKGDRFKLIFEEQYVDGEPIGIGKIIGAQFNHAGQDLYAFLFEKDTISDYFDEQGNSLRKAFLKAPLKFSRISSRFSRKRFHPVLKRYKAHLGTDYAAPHGTPILAVGDGTVVKASYTKGNGKFVKINHNSTYETQYLHMSKRAVKVGDFVRQGETIGYVGSTGLATGPHVCFRFWKNGQQIDHMREKFPAAHPIGDDHRASFESMMNALKSDLDMIPYEGVEDVVEMPALEAGVVE